MNKVTISGRNIGQDYPPYIIAELSANHNGSLKRALDTITMAKSCGADAVKIQTYTADTMTIDCNNQEFTITGGAWKGYNLYRLYEWAQTPYDWHQALFDHAREIGITIFSTPFDESAVDLLEDLNTPAYKIASFEAVDIPLIKYVAKTGKPIIISTGMANYEEITEAVNAARSAGCNDLVLLHCISSYPAPVDQSNLKTIPDLAKKMNVVTGLSDHTLGTTVSIASVALGASIIEKHVTLNRNEKGPDSEFSLEPNELELLCRQTNDAWQSLGKPCYELKASEDTYIKYRRSIYVVKDIKSGEKFTEENIRRIRPGYGLSPKYFDEILGKQAACDLLRGTALKLEDILQND